MRIVPMEDAYLSDAVPPRHEQHFETTHLEMLEPSAVDLALHRSVVVRAEPVDHCLSTIRPVTEHEDVDLRTGAIRWYPRTALAGRGRPDPGTIGRHNAGLPLQS